MQIIKQDEEFRILLAAVYRNQSATVAYLVTVLYQHAVIQKSYQNIECSAR